MRTWIGAAERRVDPARAHCDRDPRDRRGRDAGRMDVQLLLTDAIERAAIALDHLGPDDISIERVGAAAVGHCDDQVVEPRAHGRRISTAGSTAASG